MFEVYFEEHGSGSVIKLMITYTHYAPKFSQGSQTPSIFIKTGTGKRIEK
jgi:hypothetical protein